MNILFLDTEVTGLKKEDKICQIAFLLQKQQGELELYAELCNPYMPIALDATQCHGITDKDVVTKDPLSQTAIYKKLVTLNKQENCFVAHNAKFDIDMLNRDEYEWNGKVIDTLKCARVLYEDNPLKSFALQNLRESLNLSEKENALAKELGIEIKAHDAAGDVISLYALTQHLMQEFTLDIEKLIEISSQKTILKRMPYGRHKGKSFDEIAKDNPEYLNWIINDTDFEESIFNAAKQAFEGITI